MTLLSLAGAAPAIASSTSLPPGGGAPTPTPHPAGPAAHTVVTGGMPGWQIALIAIAAALAGALAAVLLDRARSARRRRPVMQARQAQTAAPR